MTIYQYLAYEFFDGDGGEYQHLMNKDVKRIDKEFKDGIVSAYFVGTILRIDIKPKSKEEEGRWPPMEL